MDSSDVEQEQRGRCPECGQAHPVAAKFCMECGTRLASEPEREARKTVTAVFADVVGSTPLQERIDAEAAHHVMDRFYHAMREVLEAHDGRVAKFIGDAVVAIFGVPAVREDDALRAVQAAGAMRDTLAALNDELERDWGVRIGMRVGVNTGEVVISPEGLAIGDAMNTAARLEQAAGEGEVLIGETTYRHVRHAVHCEPVAPLTLKGKREPVTAFLLVHAPATGGQQRARIEAPLIGRDPELQRLLAAFDQAVQEQACRLVTVIGSPGLGKTRLSEELAATLADRATVVQGRCEPTGEGITFLPVAEVLRGAAQIGDADEPAVVREKLAALLPGDPDSDLLVERAGGVLGIAKPATAEETFWSVRRLLGGLARERPLVVVLDDVHWGEPTFLDLVEHLAEWGRQAPILLLALARPELRDLRPALTEPGGIAADVVELVPLAEEHCRALVHELLDRAEVPEALAGRVLQTTGGNPLFLGETLRMFVDDGVLLREDSGWVTTVDADDLEVPPTITALLAARIARLGAAERSVVERAAVIGKQFYRGAVADLAPAPVAAGIDEHLLALRRKEVVEPDGTMWIDEPVFRFHHVLIRDAAYRTLLKDARAELHERFADWLCDKAGALVGEHEEVIAFHLEQAYEYRRELGPLDEHGRALGDRAVALLHSTGRRALTREDLPAATNLLGRAAVALVDDAPGAADVLIDLLEALLSAGQADDVAQVAERLRALTGHGERPAAWATIATAQLAQLTDSTGLHASLAEIARAGDALGAAGDDTGLAKAHHVRAQALALLGQVAEVEAALDQALAAARRGGDTRRATAVLSGAPRAALWGPSPVMRSSGRCLDVVRILRMAQGNRHVEAIALRCQAVLEAMRGRADAAREILDRCRMTLEELGLRLELLETEQYSGIVELVAGDDDAAEAHLRTAYDGFAERGLDVGAAAAAALLARALVQQGRDEEALELTRFSEQRGRENLKTTIAWCGVRARVLARRGEHEDAEALAGRAVALADGTDALVDHGDARLDLAHVLRAAGQEKRALAEAHRAAELYEAKGHEAGAARAAAFAHEERHAQHPAVDTDALPAGVPAGPMREMARRQCAGINQRDEELLRSTFTEDVVVVDRRPVSGRDTQGAGKIVRSIRGLMAASDDLRSDMTVLVATGDLGVSLQHYVGHSNDGGGAFAIPILLVARLVDGRVQRGELFLPEDERAALDRLLELHPHVEERAAWSSVLGAMHAFNERDLDALEAVYAEAYARLPEGRMCVEIVATAGARAVLSRLWIDADTPVEGLGQVVNLEDGVAVSVELFDTGDGAAMRARFAALGGSAPDPESVLERAYAAHCVAFNARDWDAVRDGWAEDLQVLDRRRTRVWPDLRGREEVLAMWMDLPSMAPDMRVSVDILEGDDESAVMRYAVRGHAADGGGELEFEAAGISVMRDGRPCYSEFFDDDEDLAVLRRRREELRPLARRPLGAALPDEPLPVEHWQLRFMTEFDRAGHEGRWDDVRALLAPEFVSVDNRRLRTFAEEPAGGREAFIDRSVSLAASTHDLQRRYELLAASPTLTAVTVAAVGRMADGDGPFEMSIGVLVEWRDGVLQRAEFYDPEDEDALLARFAELDGADDEDLDRAARALRRAGRSFGEQVAWTERWAVGFLAAEHEAARTGDWSGARAMWADDLVVVDHRSIPTMADVAGADEYVEHERSLVASARDVTWTAETLAAGDAHLAGVGAVHGRLADDDGALEMPFAFVLAFAGGRATRIEFFEADDEAGACARYGELEDEAGSDALLRALAGARDSANARDLDALGLWHAEGFLLVDRRLAGWSEIRGRQALVELYETYFALAPDIQFWNERLAGDDEVAVVRYGWAGHALPEDGGGRFEDAVTTIGIVRRGVFAYAEHYPDAARTDLASLRARAEELRPLARRRPGTGLPDEPLPAERDTLRYLAELDRAGQTQRWDVVRELLAPDLVVVDHRSPSTMEARDRDEYLDRDKSMALISLDLRRQYETVAASRTRMACRGTVTGCFSDGGGPFEIVLGALFEWRGDLLVRMEYFEVDDEAAMLARFAELEGASTPERAGAVARWYATQCDAFNARDWAGLAQGWTEDTALIDCRMLKLWPPLRGRSQVRSMVSDWPTMASDLRASVDVLESDDDCGIVLYRVSGHATEGGGELEYEAVVLPVLRDGACCYMEIFDPDEDPENLRARRAELRPLARRRPGTGLPDEPLPTERWLLRYMAELDRAGRTSEWGTCRALLSPGVEVVDHRHVQIWGNSDREQYLAAEISLAASSHELDRPYALLAASETRIAGVVVARGRLVDGGGPFELQIGGLLEFGDGVLLRIEFFDADDEARMLTRFHALEATTDREPSAVAGICTRLCAGFNARDWPAIEAALDEDFTRVDRRLATGWTDVRSAAEQVAALRDLLRMSPDLQIRPELVEGDDEVAIVRWGWRGHATEADGGGELEVSMLLVVAARAGRALRAESHEFDADIAILRARAEELRPLARRRPGVDLSDEPLASERWLLRYATELDRSGRTGEWDSVREILAPSLAIMDRRRVPVWGELRGREEYLGAELIGAASTSDVTRPYELIAAGITCSAAIATMSGRLTDGDGPFELHIAGVFQWRDGVVQRIEWFDPEDEDAMLARFAELEAMDNAG